jgi:hypothetical protein
MDLNVIVIDNFLDNPNKVRESVLKIDFPTTGSFPGKRSLRADENYQKMVKEKLEKIFNKKLFFPYKYDSFCFQFCLENDESWVHTDGTEWAGVLYLTPNAPAESGTGLFTKVEEEYFLNTILGNVYNRMVLYRGDRLPHRSMISGFGNDIETGRLTQVLFFNTYDNGEKQLSI